jgi:hypothetical protein
VALRVEAWAAEPISSQRFARWTPQRKANSEDQAHDFEATSIIVVYLLSVYTMSLRGKLAN